MHPMTALLSTLAIATTALALGDLKGNIRIDGSSTVFPITEAVAEEFAAEQPNVNVTVGVSGTGGGFKRFCAGEIDIADASRPIKPSEMQLAAKNGIEFIEIPVAYDGLTVVVNTQNTWATDLTVDNLKRIFSTENTAKTWRDVNPAWPAEPILVYSPGTDSGTFDYFKEVVLGRDGKARSDMSVSEDDNALVLGVSGNKYAIGFFGCAYYFENTDKLTAVKVNGVSPSVATIENGTYAPFSRPLFIYVNAKAASQPQVKAFVDFYLAQAPELAGEVGYVKFPAALYGKAAKNWTAGRKGTQFTTTAGESVTTPFATTYQ
ncbi:MAG: PstS family phosphate ABC transporter substrate-binding protein [Planctomycetota bacterium]|nr:PstS family phosphate ABC transporter substrate-binding protein [Planctomycetota bacterium]MDA1105488.1 PstS family phosphate ABC transporter substrate-binding protein [Planctomycetota bacterium]